MNKNNKKYPEIPIKKQVGQHFYIFLKNPNVAQTFENLAGTCVPASQVFINSAKYPHNYYEDYEICTFSAKHDIKVGFCAFKEYL